MLLPQGDACCFSEENIAHLGVKGMKALIPPLQNEARH